MFKSLLSILYFTVVDIADPITPCLPCWELDSEKSDRQRNKGVKEQIEVSRIVEIK